MVDKTKRDRQNGTTLEQFVRTHGYMPVTVTDHRRQANGVTLITLESDPSMNIEVYHDDRPPHRSGELPR
jgi:hypothetical protein